MQQVLQGGPSWRLSGYVTPPMADPPTAAAPAIIIGTPATAPAVNEGGVNEPV